MIKRHVLNKLLLLRLIQLANGVNGATRLQKMVFKAESLGRDDSNATFNYKFIRWHYGPYSEELKDDLQFLIRNNLVEVKNNAYTLTASGIENINKALFLFEQVGTDSLLNNVITRYNTTNLDRVLREIYLEYGIEANYEKGDTIFPIIDEEAGELTNVH
ncbi:hypothetical protein LJK88_09925 [Paenibacillus sp. P26]|nr:hypothetical protein LJK88_09925 [Paenibacillus sp. P26]UUZ89829.1 hypothetical protein LJK87_27730 [Paenibacillus sp. P25]